MKKIYIVLILFFTLINSINAKILKKCYVIKAKGIINSIMASYIVGNISKIEERDDGIIIIEMDTPGGLMEAMRSIVLKIMNSRIPIIGYVAPDSARAGSAGAFIMLSCDILVMAPIANIGAAHPVNLGKKMDPVMEEKIVNDTVSFIKGIAKKRGKNQNIAEKMVVESISLTTEQAIKKNICDFSASSISEIIEKIKNKEFIKQAVKYKLDEKELIIENIEMNIFEKFLFKISHPNIAYILLILGIYGILAEFSTPGIGFPGVFGSISLILAFIGLNTLPISLAGLILIVVGIILFVLELYITSGGILGVGSVVSIILGSIMLIRTSSEFLEISPYLIITFAIFTIFLFFFLATMVYKIHSSKPDTGREGLIGQIGVAKEDIKKEGYVFVKGELWKARPYRGHQIKKGDKIRVVDIKNLLLVIKRVK